MQECSFRGSFSLKPPKAACLTWGGGSYAIYIVKILLRESGVALLKPATARSETMILFLHIVASYLDSYRFIAQILMNVLL